MDIQTAKVVKSTLVSTGENPTVKHVLSVDFTPLSTTTPTLIACVDNSGSMSGGLIERCNLMLQKLFSGIECEYISFNHVAFYLGRHSTPPIISSSGGTSFIAALGEISTTLLQRVDHSKEVILVFMSDGESHERIGDKVASIRKFMGERPPLTVHSLGIGSGADCSLLLSIRTMGGPNSTYGYLNINTPNSFEAETERLRVLLKSSTPVVFRGTTYYIPEGSTLDVYLPLSPDDGQLEEASDDDKVEFIKHQLDKLLLNSKSLRKNMISHLAVQAMEIRDKIMSDKSVGRLERKQRVTNVLKLLETLHSAYKILADGRHFTHHELSTLATAARKSDPRFAKVSLKRDEANTSLFAEQDRDIDALSKSYEIKKLDCGDYSSLICTLSQFDTVELLRDSSCMCLGVKIKRNDICQVDPTQVKILCIGSFYGAQEYLSARGYDIGNGTQCIRDPKGFVVTAALPLYLGPDHWEMAKLFLTRMSGDALVRDPSQGYDLGIFYLYLVTYIELTKETSAHGEMLADILKRTLFEVYKRKPVVPSPKTFVENLELRKTVVNLDLYCKWVELYSLENPNYTHELFMTAVAVEKARKEDKSYTLDKDYSLVYNKGHWLANVGNATEPEDRLKDFLPEELKGSYLEMLSSGPLIEGPAPIEELVVNWNIHHRLLPKITVEREIVLMSNLKSDVNWLIESEERVIDESTKMGRNVVISERGKLQSEEKRNLTVLGLSKIKPGSSDLEVISALFNYCYVGRNVSDFWKHIMNLRLNTNDKARRKSYFELMLGKTITFQHNGKSYNLDCSRALRDLPVHTKDVLERGTHWNPKQYWLDMMRHSLKK